MCGVIALLLASQANLAAPEICEALSLLQHRGQDACGVVTCGAKGRFYQCKSNGMVRDVLDAQSVASLQGSMGVGHVRYPTAGSSAHAEAQPFYVNSPYGIVFAHNGNLVNTPHLRYYLDHYGHRHINTDSDSELLLNLLADNLQKTGKFRIDADDIFRAVSEVMHQCHGAYACVAMLAGFGLIAFRDPNGIRPLGYARRPAAENLPVSPGVMREGDDGVPMDYMVTSESVTGDALGFSRFTDIAPGSCVIITRSAGVQVRQCIPQRTFAPDMFEYVYFARPDSVLDGISVYRSRMAMGDALGARINTLQVDIDVVMPVPDTSRVAALQVAQILQKPYREGFVKNRYVGRTFIMPGQSLRRKNVRRKLNAMALEFKDKNVLLVDDSIVRGTTSKEIVLMARDAGAKRVFVASCAPPIRFPNVYGIDMPSRRELVAHGRTEAEIAEAIGADMVVFQTLPDLIASCSAFNPSITNFDCSVFTGHYVSGQVDTEYLDHLENLRNDHAKAKAGPGASTATNAPSALAAGSSAPASSGHNTMPSAMNGFTFVPIADPESGCNGPMSGADAAGKGAGVGLAPSFMSHAGASDGNDHLVGLGNARSSGQGGA